ncbi:MAG TPA: HU family DNA-binding protein [Syntrophales bacterium]|nr:HU family DNA-binding protein [Syntrophales bacterium]
MAKAARVIGKVDLVGNVAQITELTKENAKKATNAVLEGMQALLQQSGKIQLAKFGSFTIRKTKSRRGRNPQTGQPILIPPGVRIAFKVSKTWKDAVLAREQEQLKDKVRIHAHKEAPKAKPVFKPVTKPAVKPAAKAKAKGNKR